MSSSSFTSDSGHCMCFGINSRYGSKESCTFYNVLKLSNDLRDFTKTIVGKQPVLLKGLLLKENVKLQDDHNIQSDQPIQSVGFEKGQEICYNVLNATLALQFCKNIVGERLWREIWQTCVEESQVE